MTDYRTESPDGTLRAHPDDLARGLIEIAEANGFEVVCLVVKGGQWPFPQHKYEPPVE